MKLKEFPLVLSVLTILSSCSGGSGSSETVSFQFKDEAVDNLIFEKNGTVVSQNNFIQKLSNFFIDTAFSAVDRQIECKPSDQVSFDMDILGTPLVVELPCSAALEKKLRAAMLESMAGKQIILEYSGGSEQFSESLTLDFRDSDEDGTGVDEGERGFFGKYNNINPSGANAYCRETYDFNKSDGTVTLSLDVENTKAAAMADGFSEEDAIAKVEECAAGDGGIEEYTVQLSFRFKDGYLEFDPEGVDFSDDLDENDLSTYQKLSDYQRFCVKSAGTDTCDTASLPNATYVALEEVCHPEDSEQGNCPEGSVDPW
jgi:hypothetical protein